MTPDQYQALRLDVLTSMTRHLIGGVVLEASSVDEPVVVELDHRAARRLARVLSAAPQHLT